MTKAPPTLQLQLPGSPPPHRGLKRWLAGGGRLQEVHHGHTHPWYMVLWLTGVDYFSTLGYQPGIALLAAGSLSPIATLILVGMTLAGALPTYAQVARRSYAGQGSIAMLESLLDGWKGKVFVLTLIGFAATDFVITMTLSSADAAKHAIENPWLHPYLGDAQMVLTMLLLALLAVVFLRGFKEAIGVAAFAAVPYIILNLVVLTRGLIEIARRPELIENWRFSLVSHGDWTGLLLVSALVFPKLALGMSGFETGVAVMPLVDGGAGGAGGAGEDRENPGAPPVARIRATRQLLMAAALLMSVLLLLSSFVTTLLVPEDAYRIGGPASGRALAYLAHSMLGSVFGTVYDVSTIVILWFAGASAMAGMLSIVPRYLPRLGMAPVWVSYRRPLVLVLLFVTLTVTFLFEASVEAQASAYATGVLVLMLSAAVAVALELWRESSRPLSLYFWLVSAVFVFTLIDNVIERPDGVIIAGIFIACVVAASAFSRYRRSTELRVANVAFTDEESGALWRRVVGKKVHLVPLRTNTKESRARKAADLRKYYSITGPIAFVHVSLVNNRSEFLSSLRLRVVKEDDNYVFDVTGATAIANTIVYISELIDPKSIFLGLTRLNLMSQALRYIFWGEGETGLMVYTILLRHWESTPEDDVRPLLFLMSE